MKEFPALYIHSLFGSKNDHELFEKTGQNRSLNRGKLNYEDIKLLDKSKLQTKIFNKLKTFSNIRKRQFHPNAVLVKIYMEYGDKVLIKSKVFFVFLILQIKMLILVYWIST